MADKVSEPRLLSAEELERMRSRWYAPALSSDMRRTLDHILALQQEIERLRAVVEWYADDSNWTAVDPYPNSVAEQDEGARAKAALTRAVGDADSGVERIRKERQRQIAVEGYDAEHDAAYEAGHLRRAAIAYIVHNDPYMNESGDWYWPWELSSFKPADIWEPTDEPHTIKHDWQAELLLDLTKAGALIAAEIDRLLDAERSVA